MKVLFLPHRVPFPPDKGDRIRSYHLLRYLTSIAEVDVATLSDEPIGPPTLDELSRLCNRISVVPLGASRWANGAFSWLRAKTITEGLFKSKRLSQLVSRWTTEVNYDAIVVVCSSMVQYLSACSQRPGRTIVALIDVDSEKWFAYADKAKGLRKELLSSEAARLRVLERKIAEHVDDITLVSEAEVKLYRTITSSGRVHAVPNGVDLNYFQPSHSNEDGCDHNSTVFVGALNYQANIDGLVWYCRHVWPQLRQQQADAVFRIVGRRPTSAVQSLGRLDGVEVVGEVDDVRPFIRSSEIVVAPLRIARGIQNKVLEALAMGKPVIASAEALTGISLEPGVHAVQAETVGDWIQATLRLWNDPVSCRRIGDAGRGFVERNHSWDVCLSPFRRLLEQPLVDLASSPSSANEKADVL